MKIGETTQDWCMRHGHADFFFGYVEDDKGEIVGEAIHCPYCFSEHPDNPEVIAAAEEEERRQEEQRKSECEKIMHQ